METPGSDRERLRHRDDSMPHTPIIPDCRIGSEPHMDIYRNKPNQTSTNPQTIKITFTNENITVTTHSLLGKGGFGYVWVAKTSTGESYALKVSKDCLDEAGWKRLREEVGIQGSFKHHPNIVKLIASAKVSGKAYLLMERCHPLSLYDLITKKGHLSPLEVLWCGKALCFTVAHIHSKHCIHRDIKPQNLLFDFEGNLKITDFGLSSRVKTKEPRKTVVGTTVFMLPDLAERLYDYQLNKMKGVSNRQNNPLPPLEYFAEVDVWSIGIVLYVMMTGKSPYVAALEKDTAMSKDERSLAMFEAVAKGRWNWPPAFHGDAEMMELVESILTLDQKKRATMDDLLKHPVWKQCPETCPLSLMRSLSLINVDGPSEGEYRGGLTPLPYKRSASEYNKHSIDVCEHAELTNRAKIYKKQDEVITQIGFEWAERLRRDLIHEAARVEFDELKNSFKSLAICAIGSGLSADAFSPGSTHGRRSSSLSMVPGSDTTSLLNTATPAKYRTSVTRRSVSQNFTKGTNDSVNFLSGNGRMVRAASKEVHIPNLSIQFEGRATSTRWGLRDSIRIPQEVVDNITVVQRCLNNHSMTLLNAIPRAYLGIYCSVCKKYYTNVGVVCLYRCSRCDFDICQQCVVNDRKVDITHKCDICNKHFVTFAKMREHKRSCRGQSVSVSTGRSSSICSPRGGVSTLTVASKRARSSTPIDDLGRTALGRPKRRSTVISDSEVFEPTRDSIAFKNDIKANSTTTTALTRKCTSISTKRGSKVNDHTLVSDDDDCNFLMPDKNIGPLNLESIPKLDLMESTPDDLRSRRSNRNSGGDSILSSRVERSTTGTHLNEVSSVMVAHVPDSRVSVTDAPKHSASDRRSSSSIISSPKKSNNKKLGSATSSPVAQHINISINNAEKPQETTSKQNSMARRTAVKSSTTKEVNTIEVFSPCKQYDSLASMMKNPPRISSLPNNANVIGVSNIPSSNQMKGFPSGPKDVMLMSSESSNLGRYDLGVSPKTTELHYGTYPFSPSQTRPMTQYENPVHEDPYGPNGRPTTLVGTTCMAPRTGGPHNPRLQPLTMMVPEPEQLRSYNMINSPMPYPMSNNTHVISEVGLSMRPPTLGGYHQPAKHRQPLRQGAFLNLPQNPHQRQQFVDSFLAGPWVQYFTFSVDSYIEKPKGQADEISSILAFYSMQPGRYGAIFAGEANIGTIIIDIHSEIVLLVPVIHDPSRPRRTDNPHVTSFYDDELFLITLSQARSEYRPFTDAIMSFATKITRFQSEHGVPPPDVMYSAFIYNPHETGVPRHTKFTYIRRLFFDTETSMTLFRLSNQRSQVILQADMDVRWQMDRENNIGLRYYVFTDGRMQPFSGDEYGIFSRLELVVAQRYRR